MSTEALDILSRDAEAAISIAARRADDYRAYADRGWAAYHAAQDEISKLKAQIAELSAALAPKETQ